MKKIIIPGLVLYTLSSGLGLFLGPGLSGKLLLPWLSGFIVLVFIVSYLTLFTKDRLDNFIFFVLGIIGLNFVIQMTGGADSPFHAAYFLLGATATFQPRLRAYYIVALILGIEAGNLFLSGRPVARQWQSYAGFAVSLAGLVLIITPFMGRILGHARLAQERYKKLLADARAVDPLADDGNPDTLSEQNRQAANISTAIEREGAFKGLISMIYEMVPAHTYALFLTEREDQVFILRAIRSQSRRLSDVGVAKIVKGRGLLGIGLDKNQPQYLPDTVISALKLGYYTGEVPVKSLLAIPISQDERIVGVLVVDSLERDAFSLDNQDLLARFAPFFSQIIEKIRISQELDLRAKNFAKLHEMSSILNSSLEIDEVLDKLISQIRSVVPYDLCAFLLYDEKSGNVIITALRGYDAKLTDNRFPLEQSAILMHLYKQWQERSAARVHYDPDLGGRGKDINLFPLKEMQKPIQSLFVQPLISQNKFIGAVFLGSLRTNAFSEYHRNFIDTLLNQVAMVVDNSMLHKRIRAMAHTDGLTGLLNHRTFMDKLSEEFKRLDREFQHFSLLLLDIDWFKKVNDEYGHPVGDVALKCVAGVVQEMARSIDFVARYGGEEFAVGMVGADTEGAKIMAERIRKSVENTDIIAGAVHLKKQTVSIGIASYYQGCGKKETLIAQADQALYHAKHAGRNRVCLYKDIKDQETTLARPGR